MSHLARLKHTILKENTIANEEGGVICSKKSQCRGVSWCSTLHLGCTGLFTSCTRPTPSSPSTSSSLIYFFPLSSPHLSIPTDCSWVKLTTVPYHIQFRFLQDIHQHLNLGLTVEEKIIVHPENIFGGDLRYGQVPTSKPPL